VAWDDDDAPKENPAQCRVCDRIVEGETLPKCRACGRRFCDFCVFRVGGGEYCSRECGVRYFFSSDEEDERDE
jgi:hypothetical protein